MKISKNMQKIIKQLMDLSFKDGRLQEEQVTKAIKALKSLPRSQAITALSEYLKDLKRKEREHTLLIETTVSLSEAQIKEIKKIIEKKNMVSKVLVKINPEILGGFKLRIGDEIWDESIQGRIQMVKEAING